MKKSVKCNILNVLGSMLLASLLILLTPATAYATPRYVDRGITLPGPLSGSFDVGVAYGHAGYSPFSYNGAGLSVEGVLGIKGAIDLGLRMGFAPGVESRVARADFYARTFDRETYWLRGSDTVANPEFRVRGKLVHQGSFQLALEGRLLLPVTNPTGLVLGAPMQFDLQHLIRIETGVYMPIGFFSGRSEFGLNLPLRVMFQVTDSAFLGPSTGLRFSSITGRQLDVPLGVGGGVSLSRIAEFKGELYFNRINDGAREFGIGVGLGLLFE
jgi:hypothetical protein